jgi:hypothetical protein
VAEESAMALTDDEYLALNAINQLIDEPGVMVEKYEALIPDLIQLGLIIQHTVWRLTEAGLEEVVNRVERRTSRG